MNETDAMNSLEQRIEQTRKAKQAETRQQWLDDKAVEKGDIRGHAYWIVPSPGMARETTDFVERFGRLSGLNGYIHFAERPVKEPEDGGILSYVAVHGGITFWGNHDGGVVYGFDTGHCDSHEYPTRDASWVKQEIEHMLNGIEAAAMVEAAYLLATDEQAKAAICDSVRLIRSGMPLNFKTMVNVLSGRL